MRFRLLFIFICISSIGLAQRAMAQCQTIIATVNSSTPMYAADSTLKICPGTTVTFNGSATFSTTSVGATYSWDLHTLGVIPGATLTYTFPTTGVFLVDFVVKDSANCPATNGTQRIIVQVSSTPIISLSAPDSACINRPTGISATITPVPVIYDCAPPISDTTFLPDGSGVSYSTSIDVNCFKASDTIASAADIASICMNMEHSYIGDLDIKIICPSMQETTLKQYPGGGGTYLGAPLDYVGSGVLPGVGATYCFSSTATRGTMLAEIALGTTIIAGTPPSASLQAGTYTPFQSLNSLIGCPINGTWTLQITDHLYIDNGYIFYWGIDFNPAILPPDYSYTPTYTGGTWDGPFITGTTPLSAELLPTVAGPATYHFTATDEAGCSTTASRTIEIVSPGDPGVDTAVQICSNIGTTNLFEYLGGTPQPGGLWSGPGVAPATGLIDPAGLGAGVYQFVYTRSSPLCDTSATIDLTIEDNIDIDFSFELSPGCTSDTVRFTSLTDNATYLRWEFGDLTPSVINDSTPTHIYANQGDYGVWLVAINTLGCKDSVQKLVAIHHPLEAAFSQSQDSLCQNIDNTVNFTDLSIGNIQSWQWDFGDGATSDLQSPSHTFSTAGLKTIRLIITDNIPCSDTAYRYIYVDSVPFVHVFTDRDSICKGDKIEIGIDYLRTATNVLYDFGDGSQYSTFEKSQAHSYADLGEYYITITTTHPNCPNGQAFDTVFVKPYPTLNLGTDTSICLQGAPVNLSPINTALNPPRTQYYWNTGDSTALLKVVHPGSYRITADLDGCTTSDVVSVTKDCYIDIPNSFTPNGDGMNDYFFPRQLLSKGISEFTMTIFDRWGMKVFETSNIEGRGWDGRYKGEGQPEGVYIYQIAVKYKNGANEKYTGNITLIR